MSETAREWIFVIEAQNDAPASAAINNTAIRLVLSDGRIVEQVFVRSTFPSEVAASCLRGGMEPLVRGRINRAVGCLSSNAASAPCTTRSQTKGLSDPPHSDACRARNRGDCARRRIAGLVGRRWPALGRTALDRVCVIQSSRDGSAVVRCARGSSWRAVGAWLGLGKCRAVAAGIRAKPAGPSLAVGSRWEVWSTEWMVSTLYGAIVVWMWFAHLSAVSGIATGYLGARQPDNPTAVVGGGAT